MGVTEADRGRREEAIWSSEWSNNDIVCTRS